MTSTAEPDAIVPGTNASGRNRIETVVACTDLAAMVGFFTTDVGLRIETISPADDPSTYVLTGLGIAIRVQRADRDDPVALVVRVPAAQAGRTLTAPNGTRLDFVAD